jgi:chloramphenicol 3-O-phosphotransferase
MPKKRRKKRLIAGGTLPARGGSTPIPGRNGSLEIRKPDPAGDRARLEPGHAIFVNGIPGAGKSVVAGEIRRRTSTFRVFTGDEIIRRVSPEQRVAQAEQLFAVTLTTIEEWLKSSNVIVDGAWTQARVEEAQARFGSAGFYVILRIDEAERQRRASTRRDRDPRLVYPWDPAWHDKPGPDSLYDLVIDARVMSPSSSADMILRKCTKRWGDSLL